MAVRTGKGDAGFTDLFFGKRISKDSPAMRAIGDLDELNSHLGLVRVKIKGRQNGETVEKIQRAVYTIASELAIAPEKKRKHGHLLGSKDTDWIKGTAYELERRTGPGSRFYMPGGSEVSAVIEIARTVTRRAERSVVKLLRREKEKNPHVLTYLNCLSDVLFLLARMKTRAKSKRKSKSVKNKNGYKKTV